MRTYHEEAMRYIDNAKEQLKKSPRSGNYYTDLKYVKSAGGIVYKGIEKAAKWYIEFKGYEIAKNAKEGEISKMLSGINNKALYLFNDLYSYFHVAVYCHGNSNATSLKEEFSAAVKFVDFLAPYKSPATYKKVGKIIVKKTTTKNMGKTSSTRKIV